MERRQVSLTEILYTIIITPLQLLFEFIYSISYDIVQNPVINITVLSLAVNLLVLPLYRRADVIQREARDTEQRLRPVIDHIKKTFKGDEKVMMLQIYYKEQHYNPLQSLRSIISLLLQIPFFIAAYQFLSHLTLLNGQSVGPIEDLSKPDGLLVIGTVSINLLPVLMTVINIVSSEIYTRGQPFKDKIVLYLSAAIFLVLLYDSPSGLVFYWTLNNLFSLGKNIVYIIIGRIKKTKTEEKEQGPVSKSETVLFWICATYMALLTGLLIPSSVVSSSVVDFVSVANPLNPVRYVVYTLCVASGIFIVWAGVFFLLANSKSKKIFALLMFAFAAISTVNYMLLGIDNKGHISTELEIFTRIEPDGLMMIISGTVILAIVFITFIIAKLSDKPLLTLGVAGMISLTVMGILNCTSINRDYDVFLKDISSMEQPVISLSTEGKNVVVLMLDRAIGSLVPYIFEEKSELYDEYDGFTYYPNTISFGVSTNLGSPALYGGYEYTPEKLNGRSDVLLKDKHNEALLLMPVIFSRAGYRAVTIDPPYPNYTNIGDYSIFDNYENVYAYRMEGLYNPYSKTAVEQTDSVRKWNFWGYSIFKIAPSFFKDLLYDDGDYNAIKANRQDYNADGFTFPQHYSNSSISVGINSEYLDALTAMQALTGCTEITDNSDCNFVMIDNEIPHKNNLLQCPDYSVSQNVDNTEYDAGRNLIVDGRRINLDTVLQNVQYDVNVSAYLELAKWFDYLRDNGVWDNTRIIIVADHGYNMGHFDDFILGDGFDIESVNPVLMVKDFGSTGFAVSDEFMTNADVPSLAMNGLIDDPVNPFTGNSVSSEDKNAGECHVFEAANWTVTSNNGTQFEPGNWYSVHDNIYDISNWEYLGMQ